MISRIFAMSAVIWLLFVGAAFAEQRVALVIGNSDYKNVMPLPNPARDASAIAAMLKQANFDVVESRTDLANINMRRALREFARKALHADIAVVYYAGHGIEVGGTNYLIPVDAKLASDLDVEDETIPLDRIVNMLEPVRRLRLILLDACRENPFGKTMTRSIATRSVGRGLAKVEVASPDTLVAFAAKAGMTAEDGDNGHSPFATALLHNLTEPGLDLRLALGRVRDEVMRNTGKKQEPYVYGSIGGHTVALMPIPKVVKPAQQPEPLNDVLARDYEFAERIGTKEAWQYFLNAHKSSYYTDLARAALEKIIAAEKRQQLTAAAAQKEAAAEAKLLAAEDAARRKATEEAAKRQAAEEARLHTAEQERQKAEAEAKRLAEEAAKLKARLEAAAKVQPKPIVVANAPTEPSDSAKRNVDPAVDPTDIARLLQLDLKRVGCDPGALNGKWTDQSQRALQEFNKRAHASLEIKVASLTALDTVKQHKTRVCPLECGKGLKAEGNRCVEVACKHGLIRNKAGECERQTRKAQARAAQHEKSVGGEKGQIACNQNGCHPLPKGCRAKPGFGILGQEISCN